jgi:hypothetical protein
MRLNIRIGRISHYLSPGYSWCHRCLTAWRFVRWHSTTYHIKGHGCFPLCEKCWRELTPEQRLPFYRELWVEWGMPTDEHHNWPDIAYAVLKGY